MKTIKLIFIDLDGTLLTEHKFISDNNKEAIERAIAEGIEIIPCTGRSLTQIPDWLFDHEGINYAVCSNGATIYNFKEEKVEATNNIPKETALDLLIKLRDMHEFPTLFMDDEVYSEQKYLDFIADKIDPEFLEHLKEKHIIVDSLEELIKSSKNGVQKFQYDFDDFYHRVEVIGKIDGLFPTLKITASGKHNIEINHINAQKGHAVRFLMDKYNVKRDEAIVMGDNINDISMLEEVEESVAMGNAEQRVKDAAKYVTDTCNNDGVAKAINKIVFNE